MRRWLLIIVTLTILFGIMVVTLSPLEFRPRLPFPVSLERGGAWAAAGLALAFTFPRRVWWAATVLLAALIGLEILQLTSVDRHGRIDDAMVKAIGAGFGLGAGWLLAKFSTRVRKPANNPQSVPVTEAREERSAASEED